MSESSALNRIIQTVANMAFSRVAILAVILTGAYYFLIYDSGENILKSIENSKAQLDVENKKKIETQKVLKKEQQMKADVEVFANKFEEIKAKIPVEFLESELRSIVNQYSTQNNLKTIRTERRPQLSASKNSNAAKGVENLVEQVALSYEFEGTYANISKFIAEISNLEKIIRISDFNISIPVTNNNPKNKNKEKDLIFKASIIGYKQSLEALKSATKTAAEDNALKKATP